MNIYVLYNKFQQFMLPSLQQKYFSFSGNIYGSN